MKILVRYILSEFFKPFLLSVVGFAVLIMVIQVFNEMQFILQYKPSLWLTFKYFALEVPQYLMQIVPMAVLMAVLFSLSRLAKNNEIMAMRAGGVSIYRIAVPIFISGVLIAILNLFFNEAVVPKSTEMVKHVKWVDIQKMPEPALNLTRHNISYIGADGKIYYIGDFDASTDTMTDILIQDFDGNMNLKTRIDAKKGVYIGGTWIFYNGYLRTFDSAGNETATQAFDSLPFALPEKPGDFLKEQKDPDELNILELMAYIRQLSRNGSDCHKEMVQLDAKMAFPVGCIILALLGVPWGWNMRKYGGVVLSFGICISVAIFYLGGMQIGEHLGESGVLSPFLSTWVMNMVFAVAGPIFLLRANR